ncbi:MAG: hypothetical protein IV100_09695 [Myxococcales bacterium]|nr:hypothetical protein [Myxococcales bacterium]
MPVLGAVITFAPDPGLRRAAELGLSALAGVTFGPSTGNRRALVIATTSTDEEKHVIEHLLSDPGVVDFQVASHDITDLIVDAEQARDDDPGMARS